MEVTLALGGGGVKGNAHIGVLRVLEREGIRIRAIAGTSAGGLWGAFYAAGLSPDEIEQLMVTLDQEALYRRDPDDGPSMLGLTGVKKSLELGLGDLTFEELSIPFAVTAVDIDTAEPVLINSGRVCEAVMATIAVPGIFPPKKLNGRLLIDGGVLDPVPVKPARSFAPELPVVAVVLSPHLEKWSGPGTPRLLNSLPFLGTYLARLRIAQALNIFMRSIDIAGAMLTELRLQMDQPDVIIRPDVSHIGLLDHIDVHEVVLKGEEAAEASLPAIRQALNWRNSLARRVKLRWRGAAPKVLANEP